MKYFHIKKVAGDFFFFLMKHSTHTLLSAEHYSFYRTVKYFETKSWKYAKNISVIILDSLHWCSCLNEALC